MPPKVDSIEVVQACYDLRAPEKAWLQRLCDLFHELFGASEHGTIAYHLDPAFSPVRIGEVVQSGGSMDVAGRIVALGAMLERKRAGQANLAERLQAKIYDAVVRGGLRSPADRMLLSEVDKIGPDWMYTLGVAGVRDHRMLINHHVDGLGATVMVSGLSHRGRLRPEERERYLMLGAHVKAGYRLRRRLRDAAEKLDAPTGGAVLNEDGRVVHADGEAQQGEARAELEHCVRLIERSRTGKGEREADALSVWRGLVAGRWSLVEQFDADGRRYILAHQNPEGIVDPRGLSDMEARVTGLAVRGHSNKLIAYHLGIAEGTVASHLHQAQRKLGVRDRVELVRTLGTHYPLRTDPRFS